MSEEQLTRMLRSVTDGRPIPDAPIETVTHRGRRATLTGAHNPTDIGSGLLSAFSRFRKVPAF
ncbi:hypothetical protein, partial [Actinomadura luteofluorescens]